MSCDCNTLIVGEAGPQGPQGISGAAGTNGTNGINSFTSLNANFVQPPTGSSVALTVVQNAWIAIGQTIYISQAGYYVVTGLAGTTGVTAILLQHENPHVPSATVTSGKKISPAGPVLATSSLNNLTVSGSPGTTSLDGAVVINDAGADKDLRVEGDTDTNLFFTDASTDSVGVGTNTPSAKLHVQGGFRVTGASDLRGAVVVNEDGLSGSTVRVEGLGSTNLIFVDSANSRVGLNTATPGTLLDVKGVFQADSCLINPGPTPASGQVFTVLGASSVNRLVVTDDAVGIGTASPSVVGVSAGQTNLTVNGVLNAKKLAVTSGAVNAGINGIYFGTHTFSGTFTVAASTTSTQDVTVTGASVGDVVLVGTPSPSAIGFITDVSIQAVVSGANTVRVVFRNHTATVYTFASSSVLKVVVLGAQALP